MKTPYTVLVLVAAAALLAGFAIPRASSVEVAAAPTPVVPLTAAAEQYLVLDTSRVPVNGPQHASGTLESVLNDYGAQGWRVRTTMPPFIIFAR